MSIIENLKTIHQQIEKICAECSRDVQNVQLVAVSKKQPIAKIEEALAAGHRVFGENRVQEAQVHWADLKRVHPDIILHLIGPLQTNKVKEAVALFDVIETLDREKLARKLSEEMQKQDRHLPCFIQINTGGEGQKSGIAPEDLREFLEFCRIECSLDIQGLMCIPPIEDPPALHFALLAKLAAEHDLKSLSMGMSADFEKAIPLGATHIRVGTAIFGAREI